MDAIFESAAFRLGRELWFFRRPRVPRDRAG